jgi:chromate reductase, NAD(P)H dehydrogenase (quinone)
METFDLGRFPLYNDDIMQSAPPLPVIEFKTRISQADGLIMATPEYNYSISGVLKNAIDWASRPRKETPLVGKPLLIMGAGGLMGTSRAQYHLRQICVETEMIPMGKPEIMISRAFEKFDSEGNLTDESVRQQLRIAIMAFRQWILRLRGQKLQTIRPYQLS